MMTDSINRSVAIDFLVVKLQNESITYEEAFDVNGKSTFSIHIQEVQSRFH